MILVAIFALGLPRFSPRLARVVLGTRFWDTLLPLWRHNAPDVHVSVTLLGGSHALVAESPHGGVTATASMAASPALAPSELESLATKSAVVASGRALQCRVDVGLASAPVGTAPAAAGARRHLAGAALCVVWRCSAYDPGACAPATARTEA